jgi:predicted Kef-type K+ transport protein
MELDALITDLALILIVAGVVTLLFKNLKQPVVLGYIVAGFLVGPNFVFFPTIVDEGDINLWAELGIIVLLAQIQISKGLHLPPNPKPPPSKYRQLWSSLVSNLLFE